MQRGDVTSTLGGRIAALRLVNHLIGVDFEQPAGKTRRGSTKLDSRHKTALDGAMTVWKAVYAFHKT